MTPRFWRSWLALAVIGTLGGCQPPPVGLTPLAEPSRLQAAPPRVSGAIAGAPERHVAFVDERKPQLPAVAAPPASEAAQGGDVTLNFADTDIREVARVILGNTLKVAYTIDPRVHGTATLATGTPLPNSELLPTLETLLNQNGATVVKRNGLYEVVPLAAATVSNAVPNAAASGGGGSQVIALRYASAADLAKVLQPYIGEGSKVTPDPAHNALILAGDRPSREALIGLIRAFDVNALAGRSFALFPVAEGTAATSATEVEKALQADNGAANNGLITVVPLPRVNAVLVASSQPRYIDTARRFFSLAGRAEDANARTWHVNYVQNGDSRDLANLLQRAFTPQNVTAGEAAPATTAPGLQPISMASQGFQTGALGATSSGSPAGLGGGLAGPGPSGAPPPAAASHPAAAPPTTEPLAAETGAAENVNRIRIIANPKNNALLIYATRHEYAVISGMLRKLDIVPLQVLIDATIAEVTLNDQLAYGTQFYLGQKLAGILTTAGPVSSTASTTITPTAGTITPTIVSVGGVPTTLGSNFPGFVLANGVREVLNALADVTRVQVLSTPHVMVLDNEPARLQVGQQVPVLTGTATSTLASGAPIVNSIDYHATGVIMQVTPHINSGGLVTLDIGQEVSDVAQPAANTATGSPTFDDRIVTTRVAVQDGQTVALAGLIRDNAQEGNSGIPFLKDVPLVGSLFSSQNNQRQRTELLVMLTPHVINNQQDARALTEDLRGQLINAATVPSTLTRKPMSGNANPNGL